MGVLPDHRIRELGEAGWIEPYDPKLVQPSSLDVRLGHQFRVFDHHAVSTVDMANPPTSMTHLIEDQKGIHLHPGEFVLAHTQERLHIPNHLVARIEGKSSLGRLGLIVHATAGYIDPGFNGQVTLEMTNLLRVPILLRPGYPIAQISFQTLESEPEEPYKGRYQGDEGAVESRYSLPAKRAMREALKATGWYEGTDKLWRSSRRGGSYRLDNAYALRDVSPTPERMEQLKDRWINRVVYIRVPASTTVGVSVESGRVDRVMATGRLVVTRRGGDRVTDRWPHEVFNTEGDARSR